MSKTLYIRTRNIINSKKGKYRLVKSADFTKYIKAVKRHGNNPTELNQKKLNSAFDTMKKNSKATE